MRVRNLSFFKSPPTFPLLDLPEELSKEVLERVDLKTLVNVSKTNHYFHQLIYASLHHHSPLKQLFEQQEEIGKHYYNDDVISRGLRFSATHYCGCLGAQAVGFASIVVGFSLFDAVIKLAFEYDVEPNPFIVLLATLVGFFAIIAITMRSLDYFSDSTHRFEDMNKNILTISDKIKEEWENHTFVPKLK